LEFEIKGDQVFVSSRLPAREPFISFLVEVRWSGGRLQRRKQPYCSITGAWHGANSPGAGQGGDVRETRSGRSAWNGRSVHDAPCNSACCAPSPANSTACRSFG